MSNNKKCWSNFCDLVLIIINNTLVLATLAGLLTFISPRNDVNNIENYVGRGLFNFLLC